MYVKFLDYKCKANDPIYCSPQYLQYLSDDYGWIAGYINGELRLVIPYSIRKRIIFRIATFQSAPIAIADQVTAEQEKNFLNECLRRLTELSVDFCSQPPAHAIFKVCPDNAIATPFGSYVIDLTQSEDDLWSNMHAKHRNVILNAKKKGVEIRFQQNKEVDVVYEMMVNTMSRSKMNFISRADLMKMIDALGKNVEVVIAYHQGKAIACGIFPFSQYCAYYQYGSTIDRPTLGAMNYLHWEAIKHFKSSNVRFFDLVGARVQPVVGSKLEGIQRFKQRLGASMQTGFLWKIPLTYKYYIYKGLQRIRGHSKANMDIIDQELSRSIE